MRKFVLLLCLTLFAAAACRGANPEQQLKDAFLEQVGSTPGVGDLQRSPDEVSFAARYQDQPSAKWRVKIVSSSVDFASDGKTPRKGSVKSTWSVEGREIRPRGDQSDLPSAFLDNGLAQECWAMWDAKTSKWSWK